MRLLVCVAASMLLISADVLALDDTPTQPAYVASAAVTPREAVGIGAPARRRIVAAVLSAKAPAKTPAPAVVLAREQSKPSPCGAMLCVADFPLHGRVGGSP